MENKEKIAVMFTEKYDQNILAQFIVDKDFCTKADHFIETTLGSEPYHTSHPCLLWKTKELPLLAIKGDTLDTVKMLTIYEGKGLVEFTFNSGKCHYTICQLHSIHRIERTDYSLIVVTQNAVVPCAEVIVFGKYHFNYRLTIEGYREVEELDKFLSILRAQMLK